MARQENFKHGDLERIVQRYIDGEVTPAELGELNRQLRADAAFRQWFIELVAEQSLAGEPLLQQQREALEFCLQKVTPAERELLARAYHSDAKIREVAATSGRSVGGFYQWLYRVRQMLLDCVKRELTPEST